MRLLYLKYEHFKKKSDESAAKCEDLMAKYSAECSIKAYLMEKMRELEGMQMKVSTEIIQQRKEVAVLSLGFIIGVDSEETCGRARGSQGKAGEGERGAEADYSEEDKIDEAADKAAADGERDAGRGLPLLPRVLH